MRNVVDLGHSVQFPFLRLFLHFWVFFSVRRVGFGHVPRQNLLIDLNKLPYNDFLANGVSWGFWLPLADNNSAKGKTGLHSDTMWNDREYVARHIWEISVLWVGFLLPPPPPGYVRYPECIGNLHWIGVEIIEIWINLDPVLWWCKQWIQIEPGGSQTVCSAVASSGCCFSHIGRLQVFFIIAGQIIWMNG